MSRPTIQLYPASHIFPSCKLLSPPTHPVMRPGRGWRRARQQAAWRATRHCRPPAALSGLLLIFCTANTPARASAGHPCSPPLAGQLCKARHSRIGDPTAAISQHSHGGAREARAACGPRAARLHSLPGDDMCVGSGCGQHVMLVAAARLPAAGSSLAAACRRRRCLLPPVRPSCPSRPTLRPAADRETLRLTQQEFEGLPLPLLAQLVAAVAASLLGSLAAWGSFQPIRLADVPRQVCCGDFSWWAHAVDGVVPAAQGCRQSPGSHRLPRCQPRPPCTRLPPANPCPPCTRLPAGWRWRGRSEPSLRCSTTAARCWAACRTCGGCRPPRSDEG